MRYDIINELLLSKNRKCTLRTEQWNNLERFKEKNSLREQQRMLQPETVTCQRWQDGNGTRKASFPGVRDRHFNMRV